MAETANTNSKLIFSLLEGFSDIQKAEILMNMHDIGISERDFELFQLLRTFHILKSYIETLPESVKEAVDAIKKSETSIEGITDTFNISASSFQSMVSALKTHVAESGKKAMACVTDEMNQYADNLKASLKDAMNEALPLSDLKEAGKTFSTVVAENRQISQTLRENAASGRRLQYKAIGLAVVFAVLASWSFFYFWYKSMLESERLTAANAAIQQVERNRDILDELSRVNRTMEFLYGEKGEKLLAISDASCYTSIKNSGVIQFK